MWRVLLPELPGPRDPEDRIAPYAGYFTGPVVLVHGIPTCPGLRRRVLPRIENARALVDAFGTGVEGQVEFEQHGL